MLLAGDNIGKIPKSHSISYCCRHSSARWLARVRCPMAVPPASGRTNDGVRARTGAIPEAPWRIMAEHRRSIRARSARIPLQIDTHQVSRSTTSRASTQSAPNSPINIIITEHAVASLHTPPNPSGTRHDHGNGHWPLTDSNFSGGFKLPILRCGRAPAT